MVKCQLLGFVVDVRGMEKWKIFSNVNNSVGDLANPTSIVTDRLHINAMVSLPVHIGRLVLIRCLDPDMSSVNTANNIRKTS